MSFSIPTVIRTSTPMDLILTQAILMSAVRVIKDSDTSALGFPPYGCHAAHCGCSGGRWCDVIGVKSVGVKSVGVMSLA